MPSSPGVNGVDIDDTVGMFVPPLARDASLLAAVSVQLSAVPGIPTVGRVPRRPNVNQAPRVPWDAEAPDLLM
jgi:hypothetical protein